MLSDTEKKEIDLLRAKLLKVLDKYPQLNDFSGLQ